MARMTDRSARRVHAGASYGPDDGDRLVASLEALWDAVREAHPEVPDAEVVTGQEQNGGSRAGPFGVTLQNLPDGSSELHLSYERFAPDGASVLHVMLHEAAHGLAAVRGIRDRSDGHRSRYHNKRFVRLAEELGLTGPDRPLGAHGWSPCLLPDTTAGKYAESVADVDAARQAVLGAPAAVRAESDERDLSEGRIREEERRRQERREQLLTVECACARPRRLRITPAVFAGDSILCGVCTMPFGAADS